MSTDNREVSARLAPSQRRLQRPPDFTGDRLRRFGQVFRRHGLPGAVLGALLLLVPELRATLADALAAFLAAPGRYAVLGLMIFGVLSAWAWVIDRRIDRQAVGWILYLLALSTWEEWVFRLAIPELGQALGVPLRVSVVFSNLLFGVVHYFTLRWKWQWCVGAFLGGMVLSRQLGTHDDLAFIIALHWVATFINTPRLPGRLRSQG
ncbi:MAG: CPBP family intramembrane glutamic endopeptidase [Pseudomonadota bacterium]